MEKEIELEKESVVITAGSSNYEDLENKPSINNVELEGNLSSSDLGLQPSGEYITQETDPVFSSSASASITSNDISNWNNKSDFSGDYNDLSNKPTNVSAFTNDAGYLTQHQDISGKQDLLVSGSNIKTINNESLLGSGDITISGGEATYITDGDGNRMYYMKYTNDSTYNTNIAIPILNNFLKDYKDNKEVSLYIDDRTNMIHFNEYNTSNYSGIYKVNADYGMTIRLLNINPVAKGTTSQGIDRIYSVTYRLFMQVDESTNTVTSFSISRDDVALGLFIGALNTSQYTPTNDYNPATKKYVDDSIANAITTALGGSY